MQSVPQSLKKWFQIHFAVDLIIAIPLFISPAYFLELAGYGGAPEVFVRIIAAALLAIGGTSYLMRNESIVAYRAMMILKIIWSDMAMIALVIAMYAEGVSVVLGGAFTLFAVFYVVWMHFYGRLRRGKK